MKKHGFSIFLGTLILAIIAYNLVVYTAIFDPDDTTRSRIEKANHIETTIEGSFIDRNGVDIFTPTDVRKSDETLIPVEYALLLEHNDPFYGMSGLRKTYSDHLYNDDGTGRGGRIQLTINDVLQKKAYAILQDNDYSGSVIVMDAKNAEILAMASRRSEEYFILRPTTADKTDTKWYDLWLAKWMALYDGSIDEKTGERRKDGYNDIPDFFMAPATRDHKAPGSVFKILTSVAAIMSGEEDYTYRNTGELMVDDTKIVNHSQSYTTNQTIDLSTAFVDSTNTYFASLGMHLGEGVMKDVYSRFLVGENIDLGFAKLKSTANFNGTEDNLALMSFGQGGVAISPLHIAMIGQSIINNGSMLKPSIVKAMYDAHGGYVFQNNQHDLLTQPLKAEVAQKVKELMADVTDMKEKSQNFGWRAKYTPNIYLKTGTATSDLKPTYDSYLLCLTDDYVILVSVNDTSLQGSDLFGYVEKMLKELY